MLNESETNLLGLDHNLSRHFRMNPTIEGIFSSFRELKLELVIGVERCRLEFPLGAVDGVGNVIVVDPCNGRPDFNGEGRRTVHKVIDHHL